MAEQSKSNIENKTQLDHVIYSRDVVHKHSKATQNILNLCIDYIDYCTYSKFDTITHSLTESKTFILDIFRVCGKITFCSLTLPNDKGSYYKIEKVEKNYIGTVDDG